MTKVEVLPVPPELVPRFWNSVRKVALSKIPDYNLERTHTRLLVGLDQLWIACCPYGNLLGVVITSISDEPPSKLKCFKPLRSLTVHVAGQYNPLRWLDSARERITRYAHQHGCKQLFLMARKSWQRYMHLWWSSEFEAVAFSRDRRTKSTCYLFRGRNTPGYWRPMVPVPPERWSRHLYGYMRTAYFRQEAA